MRGVLSLGDYTCVGGVADTAGTAEQLHTQKTTFTTSMCGQTEVQVMPVYR